MRKSLLQSSEREVAKCQDQSHGLRSTWQLEVKGVTVGVRSSLVSHSDGEARRKLWRGRNARGGFGLTSVSRQ